MQSGIDFLISFFFVNFHETEQSVTPGVIFSETFTKPCNVYAHVRTRRFIRTSSRIPRLICVDFSDKLGSPSLSRWSPLLSWLRWCWYLWSLRYRPKPTRVSMVAMRHGKLVSRAVDLIWTLVYCALLWWMNAGTRVKEKENPFFATSNPGTGRRKPGKMMMMSQWRTKRRGLDEGLYAKELCVAGLVFRKWHPIILLKLEFHQDNNRSVRVASLNTCATV